MCPLTMEPVGIIHASKNGFWAQLFPQYRPALAGLEGFSHLNLVWWFHRNTPEQRTVLMEQQPYRNGPEQLGVFATRSPSRPNPIGVSCAGITALDLDRGVIWLDYIDAFDATPLLDLKPYTPSVDRVAAPTVPSWCRHWPEDVERSGSFDWAAEFNF